MKLVLDGKESLELYLDALRNAKKRIWICMYMIRFDSTTRKIWDVLKQKHAEGVEVTLWYDWYGCFRSLPILAKSPFCKVFVPRIYRLMSRNHAKLIVVDNKIAIVSGRNFTEKYFHHWVDTTVVLENKKHLRDVLEFIDRVEQREAKPIDYYGDTYITDPLTRTKVVYDFVLRNIATARKQISIMSPYFVIDDAVESLILSAANRGVKILIIVPDKPEHKLAKTFNRISFQRVHHKNVTVMRSRGMFHSKVMLFDDVALVGSANFDNRSFKHNTEFSVRLDKKHLKELKKHIEEVAHSGLRYHWIQRAYDTVLYMFTRHFMDLL